VRSPGDSSRNLPNPAHAQYDKLLDHVRGLPEVHDHLDAARPEILAFAAFPPALWRQIWSNNPISVNRPSEDTFLLAA
jgi:putative transposase